MNGNFRQEAWSENVILADADYTDRVAFDLIVNFERMLERRIPQADLARWIDCVALDGGLRPAGEEPDKKNGKQGSTQVFLLHDRKKDKLENFTPGHYTDELDGKAFRDHLGEFCLSAVCVEELTTMPDLICESLQVVCSQPEVKRVMVIADEQYIDRVKKVIGALARGKEQPSAMPVITVFTMQPAMGSHFQQEILGYSLMAALGIKGEEITPGSLSQRDTGG